MKRLIPLVLVACAGVEPGGRDAGTDGTDTDPAVDTDSAVAQPRRLARRRLSVLAIERTVSDALGVQVPTGPWLAPDPIVGGFTHLAEGVPLTAELIDDLEVWARAVADAVVHPTSPVAVPRVVSWQAEELPWTDGLRATVIGQTFTVFWFVGAEESAMFEVPADQAWTLQVPLVGQHGTDGPFATTVLVDGEEIAVEEFAGDVGERQTAEVTAVLDLTVGEHTLTVRPDLDRSAPLIPPTGTERYLTDPGSYVGVDALTLTASDVDAPPVPSSDALDCVGEADASRPCAEVVVRRALDRLWRRPIDPDEVDRMMALFDTATDDGLSWADAVGEALVAILLSPSFLFHVEVDDGAKATNGAALRPFVLANRLSYALWMSGPDDALRACAAAGGLGTDDGPCGLRAESRRLLADPRADVLVDEFAMRWLGVRNVDSLLLINRVYPRYTVDLLKDEQRETRALFRELWQGDRDLRELLTADHTWVTWRVADLYGLYAPTQTALTRVSFDGADRAGILGHASVLTASAKGTDPTSVDRATWVLSNLLCRTLPHPPPNVPMLPTGDAPITDRFEAHVADPQCAICHAAIDPYGLPLSRFDAVGELRADGSARDPTVLTDGVEVANVAEYGRWLSQQDDFATCAVRRVMSWVNARDATSGDDALVRTLTDRALADGFSFDAILDAVLSDPSFVQTSEAP